MTELLTDPEVLKAWSPTGAVKNGAGTEIHDEGAGS